MQCFGSGNRGTATACSNFSSSLHETFFSCLPQEENFFLVREDNFFCFGLGNEFWREWDDVLKGGREGSLSKRFLVEKEGK